MFTVILGFFVVILLLAIPAYLLLSLGKVLNILKKPLFAISAVSVITLAVGFIVTAPVALYFGVKENSPLAWISIALFFTSAIWALFRYRNKGLNH